MSTYYAKAKATSMNGVTKKRRGRPPLIPDDILVTEIRHVLAEAESLGVRGEGYRKVWARLKLKGIRVYRERIRKLMKQHGLQAPHRMIRIRRGPKVHDGTIIPIAPNVMWVQMPPNL